MMKELRRFILLSGALMLFGMYAPVRAQTATPNPGTVLQDCASSLAPDRPNPTGPDAPSIRILAPPPGSIARSDADKFVDIEFIVEINNFDIGKGQDEARKHWHLWLNNSVWGMFYQPNGFSGIPYGTWRVCASLGDENHADIGMPDGMILVVERTSAGGTIAAVQPTSPAPQPTPTLPPTPQAESAYETVSTAPLSPLLMLGAGIVALGAGLALGLRASRKNQ
jgi:hypothetical protein